MAPLSARRLGQMVALGERALAIELMVAAQALDLRPLEQPGRATGLAYAKVRGLVPFTGPGQAPPDDLEGMVAAVHDGEFTTAPDGLAGSSLGTPAGQ